jgi:hypothetical protein
MAKTERNSTTGYRWGVERKAALRAWDAEHERGSVS